MGSRWHEREWVVGVGSWSGQQVAEVGGGRESGQQEWAAGGMSGRAGVDSGRGKRAEEMGGVSQGFAEV